MLQDSVTLEDFAQHHAVGQVLPRLVFSRNLFEGASKNALFY
jgi:hypothetical protein